jgi:hypothetical protein
MAKQKILEENFVIIYNKIIKALNFEAITGLNQNNYDKSF